MTTVQGYAREMKGIRDLLRLTQGEMASVLGITANSVMRYENGYRQVPEPTMRFARQLLTMQDAYTEGKA